MIKYPSRDLSLLDPRLRVLCETFLKKCKEAGYDVIVTQTHRSAEYQNSLFAQGRTQTELDRAGVKAVARPDLPMVTKAKAGSSPHEWTNKDGIPAARAFDICLLKAGKANWNDTKSYKALGAIGKSLGLEWGGDFTYADYPHYQLANWKKV